MDSTRKQRRDFIKQMKKKNPNMSTKQLEEIKKEMASLGKQKHEDVQQMLIEQSNVIISDNTTKDEFQIEDESFTPDDLED